MVSKRTSSCFLANATPKISVSYLSTASACPEALPISDLHSGLLTLLPSQPLLDLNVYYVSSGQSSSFCNFLPVPSAAPESGLTVSPGASHRTGLPGTPVGTPLPHRAAVLRSCRQHRPHVFDQIAMVSPELCDVVSPALSPE